MINKLVETAIKAGGDDALKKAIEAGVKKVVQSGAADDVGKLLSGAVKALGNNKNQIFGEMSEQVAKQITKGGASITDDIGKALEKEAAESINKLKPAPVLTPVVKNEAHRIPPRGTKTGIQAKIQKIRDLIKPENEAYKIKNAAFKDAQKAGIDKFNDYVDNYVGRYSTLVEKLDGAKTQDEIKALTKQLEKLDKQAEKTMSSRLGKIGTLKPNEIQSKIVEAKELAKTRVQNLTYSSATTTGMRNQANEFINEVSKEFQTTNKKLTPDELNYMLEKRLNKIRKLVAKAKIEDKTTLKRTVKFGGMEMPFEFPLMGSSATEEIAKITKGKTPKEALDYYKTLQTKMQSALNKIAEAERLDAAGYIQLAERKIEIPIKDMDVPEKLKWLRAQLAEKLAIFRKEKQVVYKNLFS